jgi:hypothetical protein
LSTVHECIKVTASNKNLNLKNLNLCVTPRRTNPPKSFRQDPRTPIIGTAAAEKSTQSTAAADQQMDV